MRHPEPGARAAPSSPAGSPTTASCSPRWRSCPWFAAGAADRRAAAGDQRHLRLRLHPRHPLPLLRHRGRGVLLATVESCAWLGRTGRAARLPRRPGRRDRPRRQRGLVALADRGQVPQRASGPRPSPSTPPPTRRSAWCRPGPASPPATTWCRTSPTGSTSTSGPIRSCRPTGASAASVRPIPASADYLVLDTALNGQNQDLFEQLTGAQGPFRVIWQRDGIVVAARTRDGCGRGSPRRWRAPRGCRGDRSSVHPARGSGPPPYCAGSLAGVAAWS